MSNWLLAFSVGVLIGTVTTILFFNSKLSAMEKDYDWLSSKYVKVMGDYGAASAEAMLYKEDFQRCKHFRDMLIDMRKKK